MKRGGQKRKAAVRHTRNEGLFEVIEKAHAYREERQKVAEGVEHGIDALNDKYEALNELLKPAGGLQTILETGESGKKAEPDDFLSFLNTIESNGPAPPIKPVMTKEIANPTILKLKVSISAYKELISASPTKEAMAALHGDISTLVTEDPVAVREYMLAKASQTCAQFLVGRKAIPVGPASILSLTLRLYPTSAPLVSIVSYVLVQSIARSRATKHHHAMGLLLATLTRVVIETGVIIPEICHIVATLTPVASPALLPVLTAVTHALATRLGSGPSLAIGSKFDPQRSTITHRHINEEEMARHAAVAALPEMLGPAVGALKAKDQDMKAVETILTTITANRRPVRWLRPSPPMIPILAPRMDPEFGSIEARTKELAERTKTLQKAVKKQEKRVGRDLRHEAHEAALSKEHIKALRDKAVAMNAGRMQAAMEHDISTAKQNVALKKKLMQGQGDKKKKDTKREDKPLGRPDDDDEIELD